MLVRTREGPREEEKVHDAEADRRDAAASEEHRSHRKLEELSRNAPQSLWREHGPVDILISGSDLQNCERLNFFCFRPLSFDKLLQQP